MNHSRLSIASGVFLLAMIAGRAQILPVSISSGFNYDAVLESPDGVTLGDLSGVVDPDPEVLVAHDYAAAHTDLFDPDNVLPQNGTITNSLNGAVFQFQPYDALNVAVVDSDLTLTLSQPGAYSEISFLVSNRASRIRSPLSFTLNYAGGVTVEGSSDGPVPYWLGADDPVGGELAASLTTVLEDGTQPVGPMQFDEYDFTLDPSNGLLESITFHADSNKLDVYAVSGIDPVEVPEPRVWVMLLVAALAVFARRRAPIAA